MKVYAFPISSYLCQNGILLVNGRLYDENGRFLVSVDATGLKEFELRVWQMCKVRGYEPEYHKQAPQWLIRKIKKFSEQRNA